MCLLLGCVHVVIRNSPRWTSEYLLHGTRAMLVAYAAAVLFQLSDELTDHALKKAIYTPIMTLRWGAEGLYFDQTPGLVRVPVAHIKWRMPAIGLLLWTMLYICRHQVRRNAVIWQVGLLAPAAALLATSSHRTSLAAFLAAVVVFAFACKFPVAVRRALYAAWIASFLLIVPFAKIGYNSNLHLSERIGTTFAARIVIWSVTADRLAERPWLGLGAGATKRVDHEAEKASPAPTPEGFKYALRTGPHAHNVFLGSMYELGLIGSLLFAMFGLLVLRELRAVPRDFAPYALATAAAVIVTLSASFGLFEIWFLAVIALSTIVARVACTFGQVSRPS